MNTMTCKILTASIVLALSCGLGAEAKGSKTKIMTDPSITQKAIEAQMNQTVANKDVNFNNMLLQKNLASSITEAAAPEAAAMDIDLKGAVTTAIQNNRDISIAELKLREAEADVSAAAAKKNPSLSYSWQRNQYPTQKMVGTQSSNHGYSQGSMFLGRSGPSARSKARSMLLATKRTSLILMSTRRKRIRSSRPCRHTTSTSKRSSSLKCRHSPSLTMQAI